MSTNKQIIRVVKDKRKTQTSWIDSHRKAITASKENRDHPRVDCDCPAIIKGYSGNIRVSDFSFGGCFVECESGFSSRLEIGKMLNLAVKFPAEDQMCDFEIKVIRTGNRGLACAFVTLKQYQLAVLQRFFDFAKDTLPLF